MALAPLALLSCAETPPAESAPAEHTNASEQRRAERMAEIAAYKRRAAAAKQEPPEQAKAVAVEPKPRREQFYVNAADAVRAQIDEKTLARYAEEKRQREAQAAADEPARAWVAEHCVIDFPLATQTTVCDPLCHQVRLQPCPLFRCDSEPPDPSWVTTAERHACSRVVTGAP